MYDKKKSLKNSIKLIKMVPIAKKLIKHKNNFWNNQ